MVNWGIGLENSQFNANQSTTPPINQLPNQPTTKIAVKQREVRTFRVRNTPNSLYGMSEHEFNESVQRELTRIRVQLRLHEERLAEHEVRIARLENRLTKQEQVIAKIEARHDRLVHQYELLMRYVGLTTEDVQQLSAGDLQVRYLLNTIGRREN